MSDQTKERAGQTADAAQKAMATGTEAAQGIANAGMVAAEQFTKRIAELLSIGAQKGPLIGVQ